MNIFLSNLWLKQDPWEAEKVTNLTMITKRYDSQMVLSKLGASTSLRPAQDQQCRFFPRSYKGKKWDMKRANSYYAVRLPGTTYYSPGWP